ncbi:hypothetical protein L873DRAFT_692191 [Choiromyces venosus 120613-1]|uniref:Uncharacterized protein n=1 Tax=Choiromyces venosus 120613-1 TaxID=1336337 RepID=A0A3N4JVH9_9PEZI|nr:hypothetical protein L873DRAFT_692191 [Choiromyces venosus 120613-1]
MSMSTNPRFKKHSDVDEANSAATGLLKGSSLAIDSSNTSHASVTMKPCTSDAPFFEKVEGHTKDKYDVPYEEDFNAWIVKWEAQQAQRLLDGESIEQNGHDQELDEDFEAYLDKVQIDLSGGLFMRNDKGVLFLTDREEAGLVERKSGCLPRPLPGPEMTDEALRDIGYMLQAEEERFGTPMQGVAMTAAVYQDILRKVDREKKIKTEVKEITAKATGDENITTSVPQAGSDSFSTELPSTNASAFPRDHSVNIFPRLPEPIPSSLDSRDQNCNHYRLSGGVAITNGNKQEPYTLHASYARGQATNPSSDPRFTSPEIRRVSESNLDQNYQRHTATPDFYGQAGASYQQRDEGRARHRTRRRGRNHRGSNGHQLNH